MHNRLTRPAPYAMVIGCAEHDHHGSMRSTDLRLPTDAEFAHHLAELRQVNGLDVATLAARANLDPEVVAEIEAGTRTWTLDELSALAFGLGVTMTAICRRWDPPTDVGNQ
jgi:ribosome-binding protein aMBF1 (putative translation factor)